MAVTSWLTVSNWQSTYADEPTYQNKQNISATVDGLVSSVTVNTSNSSHYDDVPYGTLQAAGIPSASSIVGVEFEFGGNTSSFNTWQPYIAIQDSAKQRYGFIGVGSGGIASGAIGKNGVTTTLTVGGPTTNFYNPYSPTLATTTTADVNSGAAIVTLTLNDSGVTNGEVVSIDSFRVRFYYQEPPKTTGNRTATAASTTTGSTALTWATPANALTSNNVYSTYQTTTVAANQPVLTLTGFDFSDIPDNAVISGFTVIVERKYTTASGITGTGNVRDQKLYLTKDGVNTIGSNLAATTTNWGTTDAFISYGGQTNLWGTTWSVANLKSPNFGVVFQAIGNGTNANRVANVDSITVNVAYTVTPAETISLDTVTFSQTLRPYTYSATDAVAIPNLAFTQSFYNTNAVEYLGVDKLSFTQTTKDLNPAQATVSQIDSLSFNQSFYTTNLNQQDKVQVPKLAFSQSLNAPNSVQKVALGTLAFTQSTKDLNTNAVEKLPVPTLVFTQSTKDLSVNQGEVVSVDTLVFKQLTLPLNTNSVEKVQIPSLVFNEQTSPANPNQQTKVSVDNTAQYVETLYNLNLNAVDNVTVPKLVFTQSLKMIGSNQGEAVALDVLTFSQTTQPLVVNAVQKSIIDKLTFNQSMYPPRLQEIVRLSGMVFSQSVYPTRVIDRVVVDKLTFSQTTKPINLNSVEVVAVPKLAFTQSIKLPKYNEVVYMPSLDFTQGLKEVGLPVLVHLDKLEFSQENYADIRVPETLKLGGVNFTQTLYPLRVVIDVIPQVRARVSYVKWVWNDEGTKAMPKRFSNESTVYISKKITGAKVSLAKPREVNEFEEAGK